MWNEDILIRSLIAMVSEECSSESVYVRWFEASKNTEQLVDKNLPLLEQLPKALLSWTEHTFSIWPPLLSYVYQGLFHSFLSIL